MKIGYARVSTKDQNLEMQIEALGKNGCTKNFQETKSAIKERPELEKMLEHTREGDVVVVCKLNWLVRSLKDLIDMVSSFRENGVEFISLNDCIDTTAVQGRLTFNIFASFAECERNLFVKEHLQGLKQPDCVVGLVDVRKV
ncbi:recombinase family protein [Carboxylicivirga marina]|uniref:Recombinase family protein n=1 Tax=Carboxylicivirga marina TaxID=2800988 RepID=A0ABS1HMB8_9BACT|nr:recombinase family protein [Carboxylicivirga marina]MBK3518817.1 recombinase family protein [Carboxylicivirga marina]